MNWVCFDCGAEAELELEELYLEALVREAGMKISKILCPLCAIKEPPSPYTVEESYKILEIAARRRESGR